MCGIAGIFRLNGEPVSHAAIRGMTEAIAHRGPDGDGLYVDVNLALGHRRLAIIDPTPKASQPMTTRDGEWTLIFNGAIYNFQALRVELEALGRTFRSHSDTEVILEGVATHGIEFIERLDGMFACALWRASDRTLHLVRDRYGIKPLYTWFNGRTLMFASEIKAILTHPEVSTELNHNALNEYFTFQNQITHHTLFKGIDPLPPASLVKISERDGVLEQRIWWDFDFSQPDESMSFEEAKEETLRLFEAAVGRQMVADVPVGSYLSSGIDSGSITAVASRFVKRLSTFTAGFEMSEVTGAEAQFDERVDAEAIANRYKTEHFEQVINAGDLSWSLPRVMWRLEDPRVGMSYPNYYISRLASKFVKVCLDGSGGDELYGGYPWRYYRVFRSVDREAYLREYYDYWQRLVPDGDKPQLFTTGAWSAVESRDTREVFRNFFLDNPNMGYATPEEQIASSLHFEVRTFLTGLFTVGDKLSMAHGLEQRFPFLDNAFVDFAQKVPIKHKLANLQQMKRIDENEFMRNRKYRQEHSDGKSVLRHAMTKLLPESVVNGRKQGFSAPDESWYRGENARYVRELLLNPRASSRDIIDPAFVRKIVEEHIDHRVNHRLLIWSFLSFEWWCRLFLDKQEIPR